MELYKISKFLLVLLMFFYTPFYYAQNVGINTTGAAPAASAMLDIVSTTSGLLIPRMTAAQKAAIASPATGLIIYQTDGIAGLYYYTGSVWTPLFSSSNGWSLTGNAGTTVGTNFLGTTDANDMAIYTNNAERIRITSGGNVGIGVSPSEKLDVSGKTKTTTLQITSGAASNYILQSDASGNATWIDPSSASSINCPSGFVRVGTVGCIQSNEADYNGNGTRNEAGDMADFTTALQYCYSTFGARLPSAGEWYVAASNIALSNRTDDAEWIDTISTPGMGQKALVSNTTLGKYDELTYTSTAAFRCFLPK